MVVERACELVREHGLAALSMRAVAEALGSTPMALYHHVAGRDELARLVVDHVLAQLELPGSEADAVDWLREVAVRVRALAARYPGVMELLLDEGPSVRSALVVLDRTVSRLHASGVDWAEATDLHNTFFSWLAGTLRREERWRTMIAADPRAVPGYVSVAESLEDELPGLAKALPRLRETDTELVFATSLEIMLSGVQSAIDRARTGR